MSQKPYKLLGTINNKRKILSLCFLIAVGAAGLTADDRTAGNPPVLSPGTEALINDIAAIHARARQSRQTTFFIVNQSGYSNAEIAMLTNQINRIYRQWLQTDPAAAKLLAEVSIVIGRPCPGQGNSYGATYANRQITIPKLSAERIAGKDDFAGWLETILRHELTHYLQDKFGIISRQNSFPRSHAMTMMAAREFFAFLAGDESHCIDSVMHSWREDSGLMMTNGERSRVGLAEIYFRRHSLNYVHGSNFHRNNPIYPTQEIILAEMRIMAGPAFLPRAGRQLEISDCRLLAIYDKLYAVYHDMQNRRFSCLFWEILRQFYCERAVRYGQFNFGRLSRVYRDIRPKVRPNTSDQNIINNALTEWRLQFQESKIIWHAQVSKNTDFVSARQFLFNERERHSNAGVGRQQLVQTWINALRTHYNRRTL